MKKYLIKIMPFWESKDIGIISKLCLTYTTIAMGLFMGILSILLGIILTIDKFSYIIQLFNYENPGIILGFILGVILYIISGIAFIYHYIYVKKGFYLKNPMYLKKAYIMFFIAWFCYRSTILGLNIASLIDATITTLIFRIPLAKARKAFLMTEVKCENI